MPNCPNNDINASQACNKACTKKDGAARYKLCTSGGKTYYGFGSSYDLARRDAQTRAVKGGSSVKLPSGTATPSKARQNVKDAIDRQQGGGETHEAGPGDVSNLILGSPEDWRKAAEEAGCLGLGIPCPMLAIIAGAIIVLLVSIK